MNDILTAIVLVGGIGGIAGLLLAVSSRVLALKVDPRILGIEKVLPGANCGGCGNPSCYEYARRIVEENVEPNLCVLDPGAGQQIGSILGIEVSGRVRRVAAIRCHGSRTSLKQYSYSGIRSCRLGALYSGGDSMCRFSCLGFGDCVAVCPFEAIAIDGRDTPNVDRARCTGCGNCVKACPKELIILVPVNRLPHIACNTCEKGKTVRQICSIGCITCGMCVKVCPEQAISMQDNRPVIDYEKCTNCGACIDKCPRKIIMALSPLEEEPSAS